MLRALLTTTALAVSIPVGTEGQSSLAVLPEPWSAEDERHPPWVYPVSSAIVPGTGQLLAGKSRGAIYLVAEVFLLAGFISSQTEGRREEDRYKELAFMVARGAFSPTVRDTAFEYFERMEKFIESGPFDTDPGTALVPPMDERSFNGSIWALARETFFANPDSIPDPASSEYQRALAFYRERAVGPNFQWSWRNAGLEQDLFRQSIRESDEAFRDATLRLGLLLANHVLSALDAFVTQRLSAAGRPVEIDAAIGLPGPRGGLAGLLHVSVGF